MPGNPEASFRRCLWTCFGQKGLAMPRPALPQTQASKTIGLHPVDRRTKRSSEQKTRDWGWIRKAGRPSSAGQLVLLGELRALKGFALGTNAEKLKRPRERQKERVDIRTFLGDLDRRSRRPEPDTRSELQRRAQRSVPHVVGLARLKPCLVRMRFVYGSIREVSITLTSPPRFVA